MDESMRVPIPMAQGQERSFEQYKAQKDQMTSSAEATGAAFDLSMDDTAVMLAARAYANYQAKSNGATPLSPEEANLRYPGMPTPFREPVNPTVAQMLADREEEKSKLQSKIANGPDDNWTKTKMFGAGVVAHMLDPIEAGGGMLVGAAVGGLAVRGALGARAAAMTARAAAPGASTALRVGVNAAEQTVGNLVQNTGQEALQAGVEAREGVISSRTSGDVVSDIVVGTVAGTMFGTVVSEGARAAANGLRPRVSAEPGVLQVEPPTMAKEGRALLSTSPEADLPVMRNIVQAAETDIVPNPRALLDVLAKETSVDLPPGNPTGVTYTFQPVAADNFQKRAFFAGTRDAVPSMKAGELVHMGDDYGFGTHITDHPGVANAASARSMADAPGMVHELQITGELKPLAISEIAPEGALREGLTKILGEDVSDVPIKQVLEAIRDSVDEQRLAPEALAEVEALIKSQGYNALIDDGSTRLGVDHAQHNHITLLDDTLVTEKGPRIPDEKMVRVPTEKEVRAQASRMEDPQSKFFMDPEEHAQVREAIEQFKSESKADLAKLTQTIDEALLEVYDLMKQDFFTEAEGTRIREDVMAARKLAEQEHSVLKAFKACAGM